MVALLAEKQKYLFSLFNEQCSMCPVLYCQISLIRTLYGLTGDVIVYQTVLKKQIVTGIKIGGYKNSIRNNEKNYVVKYSKSP